MIIIKKDDRGFIQRDSFFISDLVEAAELANIIARDVLTNEKVHVEYVKEKIGRAINILTPIYEAANREIKALEELNKENNE